MANFQRTHCAQYAVTMLSQVKKMSRIEPFRKPFDSQTRKQKKHRRIANSIDGRIFQSNGRLYLISRAPTFNSIVDLLAKLSPVRFADDDKTLDEIAFSSGTDGQLTESVLGKITQSIASCKIQVLSPRRPSKTALREINRLEARAKYCWRVARRNEFRTRFILSPKQETEFEQICSNAQLDALTPFESFLARVVFWFAGKNAVERYVAVLAPPNTFERNKIQQINSMISWLTSIQRRVKTESLWLLNLEFRKSKNLQKMICRTKQYGFAWSSIKGTFPEKLAKAIENFTVTKLAAEELVDQVLPATIAGWVICDQGFGPLPKTEIDLARFRFNHQALQSTAQRFIHASTQPAYDRWLKIINSREYFSSLDEKFAILAMLNRGANACDAIYVSNSVGASSVGNDVDLKQAKRLIEQMRRLIGQPGGALDTRLIRLFYSGQALKIGERVFGWLDSFPEGIFGDRTIRIVINLFDEASCLLNSTIFGPRLLRRIETWSNRQYSRRVAVENESQLPPCTRLWIRRMGYYQRLRGEATRVPKSLSSLLSFRAKRVQEMNYLQARFDVGTITREQQNRLRHLATNQPQAGDLTRYVRTAQDACLLTGLDALRQLFVDVAKEVWHLASKPANESWSLSRWIAMARWTCEMDSQEKHLLRTTMQAWHEHGDNFKRFLPFNRAWLAASREHFSKPKHWLNPKPFSAKVNGQCISLKIVTHPIETYQMGTYFNTCLSQGGCNEMSVLPNAADANKQVVFVYNKRNEVIGRQLIAINKDFRIGGYHMYMDLKDTGITRESLQVQFQAFAQQIANQCGLELCFDSDPEPPQNLSRVYWYDDEVVPWIQ